MAVAQSMFDDVFCPGCEVALTEDNVGGYRCYCETCVAAMPEIPKEPAGAGFYLYGKYPTFKWVAALIALDVDSDIPV
jgi:hypothetical protein